MQAAGLSVRAGQSSALSGVRLRRVIAGLALGATLLLSFAGCARHNASVPNALAPASEAPAVPLAAVEAAPKPRLPSWIEQITPTGEALTTAQIRIIFKDALIPVEAIESPDQQSKLQQFEIAPDLPGHFRFLTPRMVGFQADRAIPLATRVRVTLKSGLSDLKNHRLDHDLVWTFTTQRIEISNLPGGDAGEPSTASEIKPTIDLVANTQLDLRSLSDRASLSPDNGKTSVPLDIVLQSSQTPSPDEQNPAQRFDVSARTYTYSVTPKSDLAKATHYDLTISPGLQPAGGNLASDKTFKGDFQTYSPLALRNVRSFGEPDSSGAPGRFVNGAPELLFNNGLAADSAYTASLLNQIDGPVLLVGHSYAGAVITNAATSTPNVAGLVYIAAVLLRAIQPDGGTVHARRARPGRDYAAGTRSRGIYPGSGTPGSCRWPPPWQGNARRLPAL